MRRHAARLLAVALALACTTPRLARAVETQADTLFTEGRDLLEKGRFAEACEKLRRSEELAPAVGTLINLGYCYEQIGHLRSAMDAYAEAELLAREAKDEKRERFARERFAAVEPKALKLVVRVAEAAKGLEVKRNGIVVPPATWGIPVAVDPEDFAITAEAPGRRPWRGAVIGRGEGAVVTVIVPQLEEAGDGALETASAAGRGDAIGTRRLAAIGFGGVALATFGAGAALGIAAKSRYEGSLRHCDAGGCDPNGIEEQRGAVVQGNVATILVAVGLLCVGAGAYLWLTGGPGTAEQTVAIRRPGAFVW